MEKEGLLRCQTETMSKPEKNQLIENPKTC